MAVDRRQFLKSVGVGAGLSVTGARLTLGQTPEVVVIGAGAFGAWTALNLRRLGARVTVVDAYGPANSRATSGGETRGVRSSYGDRRHGRQWAVWAKDAIRRWQAWDMELEDRLIQPLFYNTGDLILRDEVTPYVEDTRANWDAIGAAYEVLDPDEVRRRWPWIRYENLVVGLYEADAGVVRARRAIGTVTRVFRDEGGVFRIGRARLGRRDGRLLLDIGVDTADSLAAASFVFAGGPWYPKLFPQLMGKRLRTSIGHTFYFAIPDQRFRFPNMPSWGVPGATGWPALGPDHRGFRVRTGGRPPEDPDLSDRWIPLEYHDRPREILDLHFPDLAGAPINETRACHYESSVDSNFIVDAHPDFDNVWITGGGSAEGFKFGPVLGEYIANRVLGVEDDPALARAFRLKEEEFEDDA
ncbi:MAG: FAD-dependent oxidoreductase [Acidobacteriota bacterium]|nr:FAD-dependent oxidoreductase [Acidobacteriota bacterium]